MPNVKNNKCTFSISMVDGAREVELVEDPCVPQNLIIYVREVEFNRRRNVPKIRLETLAGTVIIERKVSEWCSSEAKRQKRHFHAFS